VRVLLYMYDSGTCLLCVHDTLTVGMYKMANILNVKYEFELSFAHNPFSLLCLPHSFKKSFRDGIFKLLRSPGIDSK
jgi:hypothetical protein